MEVGGSRSCGGLRHLRRVLEQRRMQVTLVSVQPTAHSGGVRTSASFPAGDTCPAEILTERTQMVQDEQRREVCLKEGADAARSRAARADAIVPIFVS